MKTTVNPGSQHRPFEAPRKRERLRHAYVAAKLGKESMIHWLALIACEEREARDRKHVHIAAGMSKDQSTISRFEKGEHWPRDADEVVAAYADDLDMSPLDIWEEAIKRWREAENGSE